MVAVPSHCLDTANTGTVHRVFSGQYGCSDFRVVCRPDTNDSFAEPALAPVSECRGRRCSRVLDTQIAPTKLCILIWAACRYSSLLSQGARLQFQQQQQAMCDANASGTASSGSSAPLGAPAAASTPVAASGIVGAAIALAAVVTPGTGAKASLMQQIDLLKDEQKAARDARKCLNKNLKNALRRKRRLQKKARQLSNEDLVAVLTMREENDSRNAASHAEHSDDHEEEADTSENL